MTFMIDKLEWTREMEDYKIFDDRIEIVYKATYGSLAKNILSFSE